MAGDRSDGNRRISGMLRDLAEGGAALVRGEVTLANLEIGTIVRGIGKGTAFVAMGVVLLVLGLLSLMVGIVLLVGDQWLPADLYWLAALIMLVIIGGVTVWLAKRGLALVSPSQLAPKETATTLKEDKEWLKQQLTSGATSS